MTPISILFDSIVLYANTIETGKISGRVSTSWRNPYLYWCSFVMNENRDKRKITINNVTE